MLSSSEPTYPKITKLVIEDFFKNLIIKIQQTQKMLIFWGTKSMLPWDDKISRAFLHTPILSVPAQGKDKWDICSELRADKCHLI